MSPPSACTPPWAGCSGLDPRPHAIVITGDLAEHGHPGAYAHLRDLLEAVPVPVHLVAGNHDDRAAMLDVFAGTTLPRRRQTAPATPSSTTGPASSCSTPAEPASRADTWGLSS